METVIITGGTGMVGKHLTKHLIIKGYRVIILTRKKPSIEAADPSVGYALWNVDNRTIDRDALQQGDYIIHLAGAGVMDKKWSPAYKAEIIKSRTESSALLIDSLKQHAHKIKAVVSASAIGWYGEDPSSSKAGFIESDPASTGFIGDTCKQWESSIEPVEKTGMRLVKIRIGIVLSNDGGALAEFKKPIRVGIAGILGDGKQVISWIHIDDLCRIFIQAIENHQMTGVYNAAAPHPVTNKIMTLELAQQMKGKFYIPLHVPEFALKIMLGESSIEVLKSTTVNCDKIKQTGFTFLYPSIESAFSQLFPR